MQDYKDAIYKLAEQNNVVPEDLWAAILPLIKMAHMEALQVASSAGLDHALNIIKTSHYMADNNLTIEVKTNE